MHKTLYSLEIPYLHFDIFDKETDYIFLNGTEYLNVQQNNPEQFKKLIHYLVTADKEIYLSLDTIKDLAIIESLIKRIQPSIVILNDFPRATARNILYLNNLKRDLNELLENSNIEFMLVWSTSSKDLLIMNEFCKYVGMPHIYDRARYVNKPDYVTEGALYPSNKFHYLGFKNIDELHVYPPYSINSNMPIKAALQGISLQHRLRRPKYNFIDLTKPLDDQQIELALENIQHIKTATQYYAGAIINDTGEDR